MMKKAVITIIGPDRPGIIASVSEILFKQGCNIENISQTTLQSEFAGICMISMPDVASLDTLQHTMNRDLSGQNLHVHMTPLDDAPPEQKEPVESFVITTSGPDKKGLVATISRVIANAKANITNLTAIFEGGSNPDRNIMIYEIDVPLSTDIFSLSQGLKKKGLENNLEVTIQHKNIFDAVNRI